MLKGLSASLGIALLSGVVIARECVQSDGMSNLEFFLHDWMGLNWQGIGEMGILLTVGVLSYLLNEALPRPARATIAITFPLLSIWFCVVLKAQSSVFP
jgi:hypothetical protein